MANMLLFYLLKIIGIGVIYYQLSIISEFQ